MVIMDKYSKKDQERGKGREQGKEQIKEQSWRETLIGRKSNRYHKKVINWLLNISAAISFTMFSD